MAAYDRLTCSRSGFRLGLIPVWVELLYFGDERSLATPDAEVSGLRAIAFGN